MSLFLNYITAVWEGIKGLVTTLLEPHYKKGENRAGGQKIIIIIYERP